MQRPGDKNKKRYRSWFPGEDYLNILFPYTKDLGEKVEPEKGGLQFPGFSKYKIIQHGRSLSEIWVFFISETFPGRDPANFHVSFLHDSGKLTVKRVYKKELPRIDGISTVGRAVLSEMIKGLIPLVQIRKMEIDNAANEATRDALLSTKPGSDEVEFALRENGDPGKTPLGHLLLGLTAELGMKPVSYPNGEMFRLFLCRFGTLRIEISVAI